MYVCFCACGCFCVSVCVAMEKIKGMSLVMSFQQILFLLFCRNQKICGFPVDCLFIRILWYNNVFLKILFSKEQSVTAWPHSPSLEIEPSKNWKSPECYSEKYPKQNKALVNAVFPNITSLEMELSKNWKSPKCYWE